MAFGDLEGSFAIGGGQDAQTVHNGRSGHRVQVGVVDETVLRIVACNSFPLIDVDVPHNAAPQMLSGPVYEQDG
jgi:hypothetical protein